MLKTQGAKRNTAKKAALIFGLSFLAFGSALGFSSFAWLVKPQTQSTLGEFRGRGSGAYFEGGDGTSENPYQIANARQLYYFSWLQDLGYFNKKKTVDGVETSEIEQTYFILNNDIDALGYTAPPAGTKTYPFLGNFNGAGHQIKNLVITNSWDELGNASRPEQAEKDASESILKDAEIIGFFGIVGDWDDKNKGNFSSDVNQVNDLYLNKVTIKTTASNTLAGLLAGYVNGTMNHCGVRAGEFSFNGNSPLQSEADGIGASNTELSKFSLIGAHSSNFVWDASGSGSGSGSDLGYGTSTNIAALHKSLIQNGLNDGTTGKIPAKTVLPFRYENTTLIQGKEESKTIVPIDSVSAWGNKTWTVNPSEYSTYKASTKGNNLGYYSGVIETFELELDYNIDDFGVQARDGWTIKNAHLVKPPDNVLTYLQTKGTHLIRFINGNTGDRVSQLNGYAYVENAQVGDWTGNLVIPSDGIWVAPKEAGTFRFVFYNPGYSEDKTAGIYFLIIKRTEAGNYASTIMNDINCSYGTTLFYDCKYGYFEIQASTDCEYFIGFNTQGSYSPYIAYMDIGTDSGSGDSGDSGETSVSIPPIDFVYYKTGTNEIQPITEEKKEDDSYVYVPSNTTFSLTGSPTSVYFWRKNQDGTISLSYYCPSGSIAVTGTASSASSAYENDNDEATTSGA